MSERYCICGRKDICRSRHDVLHRAATPTLSAKGLLSREKDVPFAELWNNRVDHLSEQEQAAMGRMVPRKMEEAKDRVLMEWDAVEAREC